MRLLRRARGSAHGCAVGPFAAVANLNGEYTIAGNPPGFSTVSADYDKGNVEYFDIYSPLVKTRYSQVYWTMMESVPLPPALVQRFAGKVMAVTGVSSPPHPDPPFPHVLSADLAFLRCVASGSRTR